jgi:hypothetical protein
MSLQARVPWIEIGAPHWDTAAETFHQAFPVVEHYVRDLFPRGQTFVYLRADGRSVVRREELARGGVGDTALTLGVPLRSTAGATERLAFTVEAPTGREGSLHGSGGWDFGARWFRRWSGRRNHYLIGAGYSHQSGGGSFLGFERSDTVHLAADVVRSLSARAALHFAARVDSSPLSGLTDMNLADPVFFYRFGAQFAAGERQWISIDLGEEIAPQMGVDTDFSLHVGWGIQLW